MATPASPCYAAQAAATLCTPDEAVVFSCPTGAHIASVCASKQTGDVAGALTYRFGQPSHIDLSYPDQSVAPSSAFTLGTMMFSGGGGVWLRFNKAEFRYTIFTADGKWGPKESVVQAAGVAVQKDGEAFANFPCKTIGDDEMSPDFFEKYGIKEAGGEEQFEIPQAFLPK